MNTYSKIPTPETEKINKKDVDVKEDAVDQKSTGLRRCLSKKVLIVVCILCLSLMIAGGVYLLAKSEDQPVANQLDSDKIDYENNQKSIESIAPIGKLSGFDELSFDIPKSWTAKRTVISDDSNTSDTLSIFSADARYVTEGYIPVSEGYSITISESDRDKKAESSVEKPHYSYVSGIGAPKIEDKSKEYYEQPTDYSKVGLSNNGHGVTLAYYEWGYEGCYLHVIILGNTKQYSLAIHQANKCPDASVLTDNSDISSFIESIKFEASDSIKATTYSILQSINNDTVTEVYTKNINFIFTASHSDNYTYTILGDGIAKESADGALNNYQIDHTRADLVGAYDCEGCGALNLTYDHTIAYSVKSPDTSGFTKLNDDLYVKAEKKTPVQKNASAIEYTYLLSRGSGYFTIKVVFENLDPENVLPEKDSKFIHDGLMSLKLID